MARSPDLLLACLEVRNLLHQLDGRPAGYVPAIDEQSRRAIHAHRFSERKGGLDSGFGIRLDCARGDLFAVCARSCRDGFQLFIGVGFRDIGLLVKCLLDKFPDCIIRSTPCRSAPHAIDIAGRFLRPVMRGQREILENKVCLRLLRKQLIDSGCGLLTMRALHIAELDNRHGRLRRSLRGAVHAFFQLGAGILKWLRTKGQDIACNRTLAVGANQQPIRVRSLRVGDNNRNLGQSWHLGGANLNHLPRYRGIVTKHLEEEGVDGVFGGENRRACVGGRSSLESGHRLSESNPGQQKSSEKCAMHACHISEFKWNLIVTKTGTVVISRMSDIVRSWRASPAGQPRAAVPMWVFSRTPPWLRSGISARSRTPWRRS